MPRKSHKSKAELVDAADPTLAPESGNPKSREPQAEPPDLLDQADEPPQDESGRHENADNE